MCDDDDLKTFGLDKRRNVAAPQSGGSGSGGFPTYDSIIQAITQHAGTPMAAAVWKKVDLAWG